MPEAKDNWRDWAMAAICFNSSAVSASELLELGAAAAAAVGSVFPGCAFQAASCCSNFSITQSLQLSFASGIFPHLFLPSYKLLHLCIGQPTIGDDALQVILKSLESLEFSVMVGVAGRPPGVNDSLL